MNMKNDYVVDQNGVVLYSKDVPTSIWNLMKAFPFTIDYDESGLADCKYSFNPRDYDPRGETNMSPKEFEFVLTRTRAIVESIFHDLNQELTIFPILESLLDECRSLPFHPEFSNHISSLANEDVYMILHDFVLTRYAESQGNH